MAGELGQGPGNAVSVNPRTMAWAMASGSLGSKRASRWEDFPQRRIVTGNGGRPAGHGLDHRQSETFVERRVDGEVGALVQAAQDLLRHVPRDQDPSLHAQALGHDQVVVAGQGGDVTGDDQLVAVYERPGQLCVGLEQAVDVFAAVEGALVEDEARLKALDATASGLERGQAGLGEAEGFGDAAADDRDAPLGYAEQGHRVLSGRFRQGQHGVGGATTSRQLRQRRRRPRISRYQPGKTSGMRS